MKNSIHPVHLVVILLMSVGCQSSTTTDSQLAKDNPSRGVIGFSVLTLENPFFSIIANTLTEEAAKHGYQVVVNDAQRNPGTQAKHIDNYIAQKMTAIVINPTDRVTIGTAVKRANNAGIPVFTNDLQCVAEGINIAGHIGTDNFQGGRLAGHAMIEALKSGGKVLILHYKPANSCVLRVDGFRQVINTHNDEVNAGTNTGRIDIAAELDGGGILAEGYKATADALQAHPDLAGIFAINDPSALGAWNALEEAGKQDQIVIIGFDGQLDGKKAIREGKIYADPIQFPDKMGLVTAQNIIKYLNGEDFQKIELIPTKLYRKVDAETDPELP